MLFLGLSGRRGCGPQVRPGLWPNKVRSEEPREEELGWGAGGEGPADLLLPLPPALTPTFWQVRAGRADQVIASSTYCGPLTVQSACASTHWDLSSQESASGLRGLPLAPDTQPGPSQS